MNVVHMAQYKQLVNIFVSVFFFLMHESEMAHEKIMVLGNLGCLMLVEKSVVFRQIILLALR